MKWRKKIKLFNKSIYLYFANSSYDEMTMKPLIITLGCIILLLLSLGFIIGFNTGDNYISSKLQKQMEEERLNVILLSKEREQEFLSNYEVIIKQEANFDFSSMTGIRLSETDQLFFHYFAEKYTRKYNLDLIIPYLFASIESDFYLYAYNNSYKATGIFQITPPALNEYNIYNGTSIELQDMYEMESAFEVSMWYINHLITNYNIPNNIRDLYYSYNSGPISYRNKGAWAQTRFLQNLKEVQIAFIR